MKILLDTNAVLAILNRKDIHHAEMQAFKHKTLIVPISILPEVDYLVTKYIGAYAARAFLSSLANKELPTLVFDDLDLERADAIMKQYPDVPLGFVDASVMALAERHKIQSILTFDRRHFSLVKPQGLSHFDLLP